MSILFTLFASLIGLFWAANHLVTSAAGIAFYYRIPSLVIGLTIVAIGTSTPEMMVGINAALNGKNELALGNAIGSKIANIGLILGVIILLRPLTIRSSILRREYPLLLLIMLFTYSLMMDGYLSIADGCLFLLACISLIGYFIFLARHTTQDTYAKEVKQLINMKRPMKANWVSLVIGLLVLPISGHYLVHSAIQLASYLGINELIIGLTIIAIGTSLPQIVTSAMAAYKGYDDIAIGTILGSNMFNLLIVLAFPAIINPSVVNRAILWRDIPVMFAVTIVLVFVNYYYKTKVARWHGGLLLLIYCCYIISLVVNAITNPV